jgi:hypothetical protein
MVAYPGDEFHRFWRDTKELQQQLRRMALGAQVPQESIRAMVDSVRIPHESIRAMVDVVRVPEQQWRQMIDATHVLPRGELRETIEAMRIPQQQWRDIIEATRIPQPPWVDLLSAARVPIEDWNVVFRTLRQSMDTGTRSTNWDAVVQEAVTEMEAADDDQGTGEVSWLLRLTFVQQLGLLVAVLKTLDELGKFMADLSGADVSPEVRSGTQVLFATVAVLLMVIELRTGSRDD